MTFEVEMMMDGKRRGWQEERGESRVNDSNNDSIELRSPIHAIGCGLETHDWQASSE